MSEVNTVTTERPKLGIRTGSSRKLLARKAVEKAGEELTEGDAIEASFPSATDDSQVDASDGIMPIAVAIAVKPVIEPIHAAAEAEAVSVTDAAASAPDAAPALAALPAPHAPAAAQAWSAEDESAFQTLLTRRKAAGYQRRGRDVGGQLIVAGTIKPNPGTVVAVMIGIVAERGGSVGRAELVDAMATADFPHVKAQPTDKGWCQGYVAGAIRNGFLTLAEQTAVAAQAA